MSFVLAIVFLVIGVTLINTPTQGQIAARKKYDVQYRKADPIHEFFLQFALAVTYKNRGMFPGKETVWAVKDARLRMLKLGHRPIYFHRHCIDYPDMNTFDKDCAPELFMEDGINTFTNQAFRDVLRYNREHGIEYSSYPVINGYKGNVTIAVFDYLIADYNRAFHLGDTALTEVPFEDIPVHEFTTKYTCDGTLYYDPPLETQTWNINAKINDNAKVQYDELMREAADIAAFRSQNSSPSVINSSLPPEEMTPKWARRQLKEKYNIDYPGSPE